jgi:alginate O-acetyltransferase complex protein AlgI
MAIGLAALFGFRFPENFNHPYLAGSVTEFWRRWHISLSTWFRDYLYIPLGGSRVGRLRLASNLLTVFVLCGLWHGASWTFLVWGLYHGLLLVLERVGLGRLLERLPAPVRHGWALLAVLVGWVIFRAPTLAEAGVFLRALAGVGAAVGPGAADWLRADVVLALAVGAVCCCPVAAWLRAGRGRVLFALRRLRPAPQLLGGLFAAAEVGAFAGLFLASAAALAATTYNPFIYFRF